MAEWCALADVAVRALPGRAFVSAGAGSADHAAFHRDVLRWQAGFRAQAGDTWALHFDDAARFAAALYGAWHAGKTVVLPGDALAGTQARLRTQVDGFAGDWQQSDLPLPEQTTDADALALPLDVDATRLIVFTSGSTGEPVAIEKRLRQLDAEVHALESALGDGLEGVAVHGTVSHQHIYGLLFRVLWPLAAGRAIVPRAFFPEDLLAAMEGRDAVLVASPAHLKRLPAQLSWASLHGRLRAVFSSGGALPADAAHDTARLLGVPPTEILGSTETGGIAWRRWNTEQPAWTPLPGVDWRVQDGVLEVHSPHLAEAAWWRSQDRAEPDDAGGFRLLGRADRIVKVEERRVSLDALERQIQAHPSVKEARVLLLGGARSALAAVVAMADGVPVPADAAARRRLSQALSRHLAGSQDAVTRPRRWRFVASLPSNAQGKVTETALTALFRPERPEAHWTLREADRAQAELLLDASLAVFDGHFAQAAVLPGVAQLDWAVQLARDVFAMPPRFLRMEALKFQRVARPGDLIRLEIEWRADRSTLVFRYTSVHGPHASGRVVFADDE
ncbi:AMP-binding protein [Pseudoxanthomonas sp. LH2527]|uniref:AMP-binding protein n=1 Tax=Pseudoxanthomonas sp. LH2527 TaxID=2923249 RepID=UPI001F13AA85|nr:AMP-binding protein [Pseudoxanthomonas sp. LH2527]MCH6482172.1 AMP-binding protein [Pseudoxanthomonas sp. LH2527]